MADTRATLIRMSLPPSEEKELAEWIELRDAIPFLIDNANADEIIVYASSVNVLIHGVLIPSAALRSIDADDLLRWSGNPYSTWAEYSSTDGITQVEQPLASIGSKTLALGEQLIFCRSFEGVPAYESYIELLQKMLHLTGLHFVEERRAWCRLNEHGDIVDMARLVLMPKQGAFSGARMVLMKRELLQEYARITDAVLVRMFDFTRINHERFSGWGGAEREEVRSKDESLYYRSRVFPGYASYTRGVQITKLTALKQSAPQHFATFVAQDFKNERITEISCDPAHLASYFDKSELPFTMSPVFFRSEVLLKYKTDREKYRLDSRSVTCRNSWSLRTYDINEDGQVHTYIGYLGDLPFTEQLHWKQYNEQPKGPISKRAYTTDFKGEFATDDDPLQDIKDRLSNFAREGVPWWSLRSPDLDSKAQYVVTTSVDEWSDEILNLDQLLIEGFVEKWLRKKATDLGLAPKPEWRSVRLIEACLEGSKFEPAHAQEVVAPLHELHRLRTTMKGHASNDGAREARKKAEAEFGSLRAHYRNLCSRCVDTLDIIHRVIK